YKNLPVGWSLHGKLDIRYYAPTTTGKRLTCPFHHKTLHQCLEVWDIYHSFDPCTLQPFPIHQVGTKQNQHQGSVDDSYFECRFRNSNIPMDAGLCGSIVVAESNLLNFRH